METSRRVKKCGTNDSEIKELVCLMQRNRESLKKELELHQLSVLDKFLDCSDEYVCRMTALAFCDGFSLGSKLVTEALMEK